MQTSQINQIQQVITNNIKQKGNKKEITLKREIISLSFKISFSLLLQSPFSHLDGGVFVLTPGTVARNFYFLCAFSFQLASNLARHCYSGAPVHSSASNLVHCLLAVRLSTPQLPVSFLASQHSGK